MYSKEKIYLNGVPVYRHSSQKGYLPEVKYVLFEDNEEIGTVIFLGSLMTREEEYKSVNEAIRKSVLKEELDVRIINYEQDRRSNKWFLKSS